MPLQKGFRAGGPIRKSRFVKIDSTADSTVLESGAGDEVFGISAEFSRDVPRDDIVSGVDAAIEDDFVRVYGEADVTLLELGATVTADQNLKSDATGRGVPITGITDESGAIAFEAGVEDDLIRVQVHLSRNK